MKGAPDASEQARRVLESLYERAQAGPPLSTGDVDGAIQESTLPGHRCFPPPRRAGAACAPSTRSRRASAARCAPATRRRTPISGRCKQHELVFAEGPAGTGKTWLAVGHAVRSSNRAQVDRLILSRPAVEAGERLGFLPGDMREKVDPYLRPIYDALYDFMEARHVERGLQTGMIEIAPLAFMRGRTLTNAVVLLDEAQNTTSMQMKMFLTRLGEGSRMIVTGDPTQIDLPPGQKSGLIEAVRILDGVEGIGRITFKESDVVRHDLVRRIVTAYDAAMPRQAQGSRGRDRASTSCCEAPARGTGSQRGRRPWRERAARRRRRGCAGGVDAEAAEVSVLLTDDDASAALNTRVARQGQADQCLSFPAPSRRIAADDGAARLGDIALAYETWRGRPRTEGKAFARPSCASVVHGVLHLLGYDHEMTTEAEAMEALEVAALATLGIADPYRDMAARTDDAG